MFGIDAGSYLVYGRRVRFELRSITDRESVAWTVLERGRDTLVCDASLAGAYYDRVLGPAAGEPDFLLVLRGLRLPVPELERLAGELEAGSIALACSMGRLFDQSLRFELGVRDDTLAAGRPVATFRYVVGRMRGEMVFPTDSTRLSSLARGIWAAVRAEGDVA
jgi:hypothetical protein